MRAPVAAVEKILPARIESASFEEPTLLLGGEEWSLSLTCEWRWTAADGCVVSPLTSGFEDQVWDLVGEEIVAVQWAGPEALGLDPTFEFRSGGILDIVSDAAFDTWVMHTPGLVLVGPVRS